MEFPRLEFIPRGTSLMDSYVMLAAYCARMGHQSDGCLGEDSLASRHVCSSRAPETPHAERTNVQPLPDATAASCLRTSRGIPQTRPTCARYRASELQVP